MKANQTRSPSLRTLSRALSVNIALVMASACSGERQDFVGGSTETDVTPEAGAPEPTATASATGSDSGASDPDASDDSSATQVDPAEAGVTCEPAQAKCDQGQRVLCSQNGTWGQPAACPFACSEGACVGECIPGAVACSEGNARLCNEVGDWQVQAQCDNACERGECVEQCTEGLFDCADKTPVECVEGAWRELDECDFVCDAGECTGECAPGSTSCDGNSLLTCGPTGSWDSGMACEFVCVSDECVGDCVPGSVQCLDSATSQTCDANGQWGVAEPCEFVCVEESGSCGAPPVIDSFTASLATLPGGGGSVTLSWDVSGAEALSIDQEVGEVSGTSVEVSLRQSTTFTLTATSALGDDSATVAVAVDSAGEVSWARQWGSEENDNAADVVVVGAGDSRTVYTTGNLGATWSSAALELGTYVARHDVASGDRLDAVQLTVPDVETASAYGIAAGPDNHLYVVGGAVIDNREYGFISKHNSALAQVRAERLEFGSGYRDVAVDANGSLFVVGLCTDCDVFSPTVGGHEILVVKYAADDLRLITGVQVGALTGDQGYGIAIDQDGEVFVVGQATGPLIAKFTNDLELVGSPLLIDDVIYGEVRDVAIPANGNVVVVGMYDAGEDTDALVAVYSNDLTEVIWEDRFGVTGDDAASAVAVDSAGNVYVAGQTMGALFDPNSDGSDAFIVKYSPDGDQLWSEQLSGAFAGGDDFALGVTVDSATNVFVAGGATGAIHMTAQSAVYRGQQDAFLVKYQ